MLLSFKFPTSTLYTVRERETRERERERERDEHIVHTYIEAGMQASRQREE